jgi:hypothetical protein
MGLECSEEPHVRASKRHSNDPRRAVLEPCGDDEH